MDIERFKRLSIPKIEAGKMTEVVRDVIKEVRTNKQNVYEKTSEDLKPLTEKFDKEIEEISKLREDVNKQVIPYAEQVQRLALPGPSGEVAPKMVADMNKGFTQEELQPVPKRLETLYLIWMSRVPIRSSRFRPPPPSPSSKLVTIGDHAEIFEEQY